jgi:2-oxoglutarate ferredoxin oxidoreductase subunit delta
LSGQVQIDRERCKGCALCIELCPKNCIQLSEELNLKGYFVAAFDDSKGCTACRHCAFMCPEVAIEVSVATKAGVAVKVADVSKVAGA